MSSEHATNPPQMPAFFDTRTRRIETLELSQPGRVSIYTCGPTVYRYAHIGNLRSFLLADLVVRICRFMGLATTQVVNITDVGHMTDEVFDAGDDKMLLAAEVEGKSTSEIADFYTDAFLGDCALAGITPADAYPRASSHIPDMIDLIQRLIDAGHAYVSNGNVYYDLSTFPAYGALSGNTLDKLRSGHRREIADPSKRRAEDFVLWKSAGPRRLVRFDSPWGEGYPGWHIECSAMSMKLLGPRIDIHTAGIDLVFPHHEDEIAQSEGATGHRVVQHWIHGAHLLMGGSKMAKSAGNALRIADIASSGADPLAFRILMFGARYRKQIRFSQVALESAETALRKLRKVCSDLDQGTAYDIAEMSPSAAAADSEFRSAICSDIDMTKAMKIVHRTSRDATITPAERATLLHAWDSVLGLDLFADARNAEPVASIRDDEIEALLDRRSAARESGDYKQADAIREQLRMAGVSVVDSASGTEWRLSNDA